LAGFLPAIGISISFWPGVAFFAFLAGFFEGSGGAAAPATTDALAQRIHQIHDVLASRKLLRDDGFAGSLCVDEIDESSFVLVFELVRLEVSRFLMDDVPCGAMHPKAMPVILTAPEEVETWMTAAPDETLKLQRPLPDGALKIVARGAKDAPGVAA
jgi:hypothetical protein